MKPMKPAIVLLIVVVVGVLSGLGGWQIAQMQRPAGRGNFAQGAARGGAVGQTMGGARGGANGAMTPGMRGAAVMGEVSAKDDKSLTIKLADGSSRMVILSGSTTYRRTSDSNLSDIVVGTKVSTFGATNSDGSITAQNVQIDPLVATDGKKAQ